MPAIRQASLMLPPWAELSKLSSFNWVCNCFPFLSDCVVINCTISLFLFVVYVSSFPSSCVCVCVIDNNQCQVLLENFQQADGSFDYDRFTTFLFPPIIKANLPGVGGSVDIDAVAIHARHGGWARFETDPAVLKEIDDRNAATYRMAQPNARGKTPTPVVTAPAKEASRRQSGQDLAMSGGEQAMGDEPQNAEFETMKRLTGEGATFVPNATEGRLVRQRITPAQRKRFAVSSSQVMTKRNDMRPDDDLFAVHPHRMRYPVWEMKDHGKFKTSQGPRFKAKYVNVIMFFST